MIAEGLLQVPILLIIVITVAGHTGRKCTITDLYNGGCSETETCVVREDTVNGLCECFPGYSYIENECVNDHKEHDAIGKESHAFAFILWACICIAIVIVGVYFCFKYRVINWLKYKINQRYNQNYDDVMIGQDDE